MSQASGLAGTVRVENVGGIDETAVNFEPGVTVLAGRNATNRTSLLRAVMAALGSDRATLKADADDGVVELELGDSTYRRTFSRRNGTVSMGGSPYLSAPQDVELADLFAFLLDSNEARRAVSRGDDLREILMRPVDTVAIQEEIRQTQRDRDRIDDELAELDDLAEKLPSLEERRRELEETVESLEAELETKRAELEAADASVEAEAEEREELDEAMSQLEDARTEFNRKRQRLETERNSVESLEAEIEDLRADLADLPSEDDPGDIEDRIERLRDRQDRLDRAVNELQSVVEFNERLLEGGAEEIRRTLDAQGGDTAAGLLPESERETICWTCGSEIERSEIESTVGRLDDVRQEMLAERSNLRSEIDELVSERRNREQRQENREQLERRIERTEDELEERRERIDVLESERAELGDRIEELEARVETLQVEEQSELLELNTEVNELEFELEQRESELAELEDEIERVESRLDDRETLEADREAASDRLQELRGRIDRIEQDAVQRFNENMEEVLDVLGYDNLERIWIERKTGGDASIFDLKIVRSDAEGTVYEDTIDHLSESEREVTGLVFALAGYLVHRVHEVVPVMVLDSLEAIDSERIADLLEYFRGYSESILVALLPEDAAAVNDEYAYIREI